MDKGKISTEALKENNEALVKKYIDMEDMSSDEDTIHQGVPRVVNAGSEADVEEEEVLDEVEEAIPPEGIVKQRIGEVSRTAYVGKGFFSNSPCFKITFPIQMLKL